MREKPYSGAALSTKQPTLRTALLSIGQVRREESLQAKAAELDSLPASGPGRTARLGPEQGTCRKRHHCGATPFFPCPLPATSLAYQEGRQIQSVQQGNDGIPIEQSTLRWQHQGAAALTPNDGRQRICARFHEHTVAGNQALLA